jgi:hypothetical protein
MPFVHINWKPATRQLRQFGWVSLILLPFVAWLWGATLFVIGIFAGIGVLLALLGAFAPRALKPVFLGLSLIFLPIGLVVGEILMLLVFLLVFLPIGLVFRLLGRDRLQLKLDRNRESYWQPKNLPSQTERYFRQY